MKGFQPGDPRAVAAGQKGGRESAYTRRLRREAHPPEYRRGYQTGYQAGWRAKQRADRQERKVIE